MTLTTKTLTAPSRSAPVRSPSDDKTSKPHWRQALFKKLISSQIYAIPLLVLDFAVYSATPVYYLTHYSPFHDAMNEAGSGVLGQFVKWTLILVTQYITALIVVSWSGRYQVPKNTAGLALVVVGFVMLSWATFMVDNRGTPTGGQACH